MTDTVKNWLKEFQRAVNLKDYVTVRLLLHPSITSFGTVAMVAHGIDELVSEQYKKMWPQIVHFEFVDIVDYWRDFDLTCFAVMWEATNWGRTWMGRRFEFQRTGRATIILKGEIAVHTHFSITP